MPRSRLVTLTGLLVALAVVAIMTDAAYAQRYECFQIAGKTGELGNMRTDCSGLTTRGERTAWVMAEPRVPTRYAGRMAWCAEVEPGLETNVTGFGSLLECIALRGASRSGVRPLFVKVIGVRRGDGTGGGKTPNFATLPSVKTFKGMGAPSILKAGNTATSCEEVVDAGEVTGMSTIGELVITFTGCQVTAESKTCTIKSVGAKEGEIVTHTLKGELGTTKSTEAETEVGLLLEPETTKTWATLESTKCSPEARVAGSLAGEVVPISEKTHYAALWFGVESGKQLIKKILVSSGAKEPALEAFGVATTEELGDVIEFNGEVEIV